MSYTPKRASLTFSYRRQSPPPRLTPTGNNSDRKNRTDLNLGEVVIVSQILDLLIDGTIPVLAELRTAKKIS